MTAAAQPFDWGVVIVGSWNVAILTPKWVSASLFGLRDDIPVQVQVAFDRVAPVRILHDGIVVEPASDKLSVLPTEHTAAQLEKAGKIGQEALTQLPRTPVIAAGVNVRYRVAPLPDQLLKAFESTFDDSLTDAGERISRRGIRRGLSIDGGIINLDVYTEGDDGAQLLVNFHCEGKHDELSRWLGRSQEFVEKANALMRLAGLSTDGG